MSEFKLHHLVSDLLEAVGSSESPETFVESLQQSASRHNSGPNVANDCIKKLTQDCPNKEDIISKYEELKSKKTDCLTPFLQLLNQISEDKRVKQSLEKNANSQKSRTSKVSVSQLTTDDLPQIKSRLLEQVARGTVGTQEKVHTEHTEENPVKVRHPTYVAPAMLPWTTVRPSGSADFIVCSLDPFLGMLGAIPCSSQHTILLDDLLTIMEGCEGQYIVPVPLKDKYRERTFKISPDIDSPLAHLVQEILPVASHYSIIVRFIEEKYQFEYGQVNHALAAAMELLIKDFMVYIAQIETLKNKEGFSLHLLNFYIQPMKQTLEILSTIASVICKSDARGGKVLSLLHDMTSNSTGNTKSQEYCLYLTQMACVPYMEILEQWIYKGVICDPYHEFLVEDNEVIQYEELPLDYSADYWEKRYMIRRERIPLFLERMSDVILRTGKYLNVIRQCGKAVKAPQAEPLMYTISEQQYVEAIEKAYVFASKTLLELLMKENDLMGRLRSVKHYFLLDQGDFIVQFMDSCESELSKNIDDIVPTRLETLLEMALRMSAANTDPYKDDMRMELLPYDLIFQMFKILSIETHEEKEFRLRTDKKELTGLLSFSFGYEVKWPVSLVLNRKAIACYQMIFRHLFYCKHIERLLCRVWLRNKLAKTFSLKASQMYVAAFALRQRMLDCVQNLEYYMMIEVIEPSWVAFLNKMNKVSDVDEVLICHTDFLDSCLKDCMLTNPDLLQNVYHLLDICIEFYEFIQTQYGDGDVQYNMSAIAESFGGRSYLKKRIVSETDTFEEAISKLDSSFTAKLVGLLGHITSCWRHNNNDKLVNLMYRLDFNGFYKMDTKMMHEMWVDAPNKGDIDTSG